MARTKEVFAPEMVAHLWANGRTEYARNPGRNFYTQDGILYSYGSHFIVGMFAKNKQGETLLLWNLDTYSSSTSRHQSHARHALSASQWNSAAMVPSLKRDSLEDVARATLKASAEYLEKSAKARTNRPYLLNTARDRIETAKRVFEFAGVKVKPEEFPEVSEHSSKAEVIAILQRVKGAEYLAQSADKQARAAGYLFDAEGKAEEYGTQPWATAENIVQEAKRAADFAEMAQHLRKQAGKPASRAIGTILKRAQALQTKYQPAADAELIAFQTKRAAEWAKETIAELARYRRSMRTRCPIPGKARGFSFYSANRLRDDTRGEARTPYAALLQRVENVTGAAYLRDYISNTQQRLAAFKQSDPERSYRPELPNAAELSRMQRHLAKGRIADYYGPIIAPLVAEIETLRAAEEKRAAERNAQKVAEWRAGQRVSLPHDVPTMARIVGDTVETSKGAEVPLEHAQRLVRIVRRLMDKGGEQFPNGSGPMVGHFRLNEVLFTGQTTIGCHVFSPDEAQRAMELIEASAQA